MCEFLKDENQCKKKSDNPNYGIRLWPGEPRGRIHVLPEGKVLFTCNVIYRYVPL